MNSFTTGEIITLVLLITSELLPFVEKFKPNGILQSITQSVHNLAQYLNHVRTESKRQRNEQQIEDQRRILEANEARKKIEKAKRKLEEKVDEIEHQTEMLERLSNFADRNQQRQDKTT